MSQAANPPIALLIPVWNRQAKLERALASLIAEAALLKVVVIDDGSEPPIQIAPAAGLDVQLIRLDGNQGIATALNAGLSHAFQLGIPYIARLDSDDIALPGRFLKQLTFLDNNPDIGICGSSYLEYSVLSKRDVSVRVPQSDRAIRQGMHLRTTLWHPTVMIRSSVARRVGFYDPTQICEDVHYFLKILAVSKAANLPEPLIRYESGASDALTGTPARRRALAAALLRLKLQHSAPSNPLWWLGIVAGLLYFLGISQHLNGWRNMLMEALD